MAVIVVTGVSRGLGRAMALQFAARGHTVCGCGTSQDQVADLQQRLGSEHRISVVDVADDSAVSTWAAEVTSAHGSPDYLINNAARINANAPLWKVSSEEFDQLTAVNINGVANTIRHFLPAMIAAGRGIVVNFSSGWGRSVAADVAPYCATKWAIEGMTKALAEELPPGLAAIPLNPGIINTDMLQSCFRSGAQSFPAADEWADAAVPYILSLQARHNGQSLSVPGH